MKQFITILFLLSLAFIQANAFQGPGTIPTAVASVEIAGTVLDKTSGEALGGVEINVLGTTIHSYTDFDGKFRIEGLQPGTYDIVVSYISYEKSLIEKLEVKAGPSSALDIQLISAR